jgi:hypothetical protein
MKFGAGKKRQIPKKTPLTRTITLLQTKKEVKPIKVIVKGIEYKFNPIGTYAIDTI